MDSNIARILSNTLDADQKSASKPSDEKISLSADFIDNFNGPILLTDGSFTIIKKNIYAENLINAIEAKNATVHGMIIRCITNVCPENQKLKLHDETGTRHFDLFAFPATDKKAANAQVLLFGKDITVEQHLTKALVQSRQMFKDLVGCSTDFAWETDNKGRFKYVSPNGILGYTAYELNDKRAADLIVGQDGLNPFDTLDAINDVEIWLQRSDSSFACVQVSANPVIDNNSTWQGARGVCRDITEIREREASLRRIKKSEQVLRKIISTIRDEVDQSKILNTTATAAMEGITAKSCYIVRIHKDSEENFITELKAHSGDISDVSIFDELCKKAIKICQKAENNLPPSYIEEETNGQTILFGFAKHHNEINGAMFVVFNKDKQRWHKDEKSLFTGVVSHLGVALEQIKNYEKLEALSNTDELTSLFNRRAFSEKINKRLTIQKRQQHDCALLFIDMDNFKQVNDTRGHVVGDQVLQKLASILKKNIRAEDFCSRLGGDEFAVWLENVNENSVRKQADRIIESASELRQMVNDEKFPLSLSIGIAISPADNVSTLEQLMEKADKALYSVKREGKNGARIYATDAITE